MKFRMFELRIKFLFRRIMICPAIMFAVSRMVKVIGRMKNLISSIININGTNKFGVLGGIKWIKKCFFLFEMIRRRMGVQDIRIREILNDKCEVFLHE